MAYMMQEDLSFHSGEQKMHRLMHLPPSDNPTWPNLTPSAGYMLSRYPLLACGALDADGRPWTTIWAGKPGFARPMGQSRIGIRTLIDRKYDPVVESLLGNTQGGEKIVRAKGREKIMAGLSIDLSQRKRVKLHGVMLGGATSPLDEEQDAQELQLVMTIEQSLGNCPKYINKKTIIPSIPEPKLISDQLPLPTEALKLLAKADLFFVSSTNQAVDMDTNNRGGPPGFVRVMSNDSHEVKIIWPEYSGNRLYQTLGNLENTPRAGLAFADFKTGDVLYLTGNTEIMFKEDVSPILPHTNLAVALTVTRARFVEKGLNFRGEAGEASPYNPRVRYLRSERDGVTGSGNGEEITATLVKKDVITPTISRYRFRMTGPDGSKTWKAGQYVALSLEDELDQGYSHMRDDDPKSLNDDYLRTFTVSSSPGAGQLNDDEFEMTIRRVGIATDFLHRLDPRVGLQIPLRGFAGDFFFEQVKSQVTPVIAGGIGITPLLAQLPLLDLSEIRLLWTLSVQDINLVVDTFTRCPELASSTTVFATSKASSVSQQEQESFQRIIEAGAKLERRRLTKKDLQIPSVDSTTKWYVCVGPALKQAIVSWLGGSQIVSEEFNY